MKISVLDKKNLKNNEFTEVVFSDKIADSRLLIKEGKNSLEVKIPEKRKLTWRQAALISRQIIFASKKLGLKNILIDWKKIKALNLGNEKEVAETMAVNFEMANYEFIRYKEKPKEGWNFVEEVQLIADKKNKLEESVKKGQVVGKETNACRELSNIPGGDMTPTILAEEIKKAIKGTDIKVKILEEKEIKKLGMEMILRVGKGSKERSKFIILEYAGKKDKHPIVLIGKGVTYDSGGLDLKPGEHMTEMAMDMSGGSAVTYAIIAAAKLKLKKHIIGLIPAVENLPSGESFRPGDIIRSMSGKTVEIISTDAEGRLIMADANTFAERYSPKLVINVATLTGAALVALGERASAIFTKNKKLENFLEKIGEESGDYVWPLPLWDEYEAEIKGINADISNLRNQVDTSCGGTILAAMFIYQFAKKFPAWAHIDIAPKMTPVFDEFLAKGAAGAPVRLLVKLIENYK